jgi:hypothetical protein
MIFAIENWTYRDKRTGAIGESREAKVTECVTLQKISRQSVQYGAPNQTDIRLASFVPLTVFCSPFVLEALDTGSNKSAIVACNKLLKKQPKNDLVKVGKSLTRLTFTNCFHRL